MDPIAPSNVARLLLTTLNVRDPYTIQHGHGTGRVAALLAEALDLPPEDVERIRLAGELHDIGKVSVPKDLLVTSSRLSAEQFRVVQEHSRVAAELLAPLPELADLADIVLHHHEYWDERAIPTGSKERTYPLARESSAWPTPSMRSPTIVPTASASPTRRPAKRSTGCPVPSSAPASSTPSIASAADCPP